MMDDFLKGLFDQTSGFEATPLGKASRAASKKALPQIRGKRIDGVLYVRAEDVADALQSQAPGPCRLLIEKLRRKA